MNAIRIRHTLVALLGLFVVFALTLTSSAQPARRGGQRPNRGGDENRPRFDPAQMQVRMMARLQERLGMEDAEWKAIEPMMTEVFTKQRELRRARAGFGARQRPRPGQDSDQNSAAAELEKTLNNEDVKAADIKTKLEAYRQERDSKQEALEAAQEKLREVLTVEQEARLVLMGLLE